MGIGVSLFLIAIGAILTWAVNATVSGLELTTIGVILMIVGGFGLVLSIFFWSSWGGVGNGSRRTTTYVEDSPRVYVPRRTGSRRAAAHSSTTCHEPLRGSSGRPREVGLLGAFPLSRERQLERERGARPGSDSTLIRPPMRRTSSREM